MRVDPDAILMRRIALGDMSALEALYERFGVKVLNYLIGQLGDPALAEEVLQDVMLAVWKHAVSFRGESRVLTWLLAIARNRALNARDRRHFETAALDENLSMTTESLPDLLEAQLEREDLREALRRLPPDQRETLELVFYHQLSGTEAAAVLGVPPGTVKSRMHRALVTLKAWMRKEA
jgi:RNA polymerase sigma-70 factor (ECF subfamily)